MAWKRIAATLFLPEASLSLATKNQRKEAEADWLGRSLIPKEEKSQHQNWWAKEQENNRCWSSSSALRHFGHLDAKEQPMCLAQVSVGVFLCIRRQEKQANLGLIKWFQIKPYQLLTGALNLTKFQASERERGDLKNSHSRWEYQGCHGSSSGWSKAEETPASRLEELREYTKHYRQ